MAKITLDDIIGILRQREHDAYEMICRTRSDIQSAEARGRKLGYGDALQLLEEYKAQENGKK